MTGQDKAKSTYVVMWTDKFESTLLLHNHSPSLPPPLAVNMLNMCEYNIAYNNTGDWPAAAHAHAHAAAAAASAYDASKSAYYQQAAAAYPAAAPPQPQPTYDTTQAKPTYSTQATYAQVLLASYFYVCPTPQVEWTLYGHFNLQQ